MRRPLTVLLLAAGGGLCLGSVPSAAAPTRSTVSVEDGAAVTTSWEDCAPQTYSVRTRAEAGALMIPGVGEELEDAPVVVTAASVSAGRATWTLAPTAKACSELDDFYGDIELETALRVRFSVRRYVLRAGTRTGVRSFAGYRVDRVSRSHPTVGTARRHFGRPSRVLPGPGGARRLTCTMRWDRIGLKISYVNWGGNDACKHGWVQAIEISKPKLWAIKVADRPGIIETSTPDYLQARGRLVESDEGYAFSEFFSPYGDSGYYPAVAGLGDGESPYTSYEAWVGAGGD